MAVVFSQNNEFLKEERTKSEKKSILLFVEEQIGEH